MPQKPFMVFFPAGKKVEMDSEQLLILSADFDSWTRFLRMILTGEPARMTILHGQNQSISTSIMVVRRSNTTAKSTYDNPYPGQ